MLYESDAACIMSMNGLTDGTLSSLTRFMSMTGASDDLLGSLMCLLQVEVQCSDGSPPKSQDLLPMDMICSYQEPDCQPWEGSIQC